MKRILSASLLFVLTVMQAQAVYSIGDQVADINCTDWNGLAWNLSDHAGKVVMINFGATW
jgi:hypothetical protein